MKWTRGSRFASAQEGFVMVISHLGNWEMFAQLTPIIFKCKVGTIYQALGNPYIDADVRRDRARLGLELFERKEGFIQACQFMRRGGAVGVLVDQHAGDAGLWCPFFSRLASTTTLAATLALRADAWLIPAAVYTDGVAHWRCVILGQMKPHGQLRGTRSPWASTRCSNNKSGGNPRTGSGCITAGRRQSRNSCSRPTSAASPCRPSATAQTLQPFRILIRGSNWLGDAVMSVPAVRAIKCGRIDAHVTILTPAKLADVWKTVAEVDEIIDDRGRRKASSPWRAGFAANFDVAILFPNSLRVAFEAWFAGIPRRVGYPGHHRRALLNQVLAPKKKKKDLQPPRHQVHHYLALAEFVGADISLTAASRPPFAGPLIRKTANNLPEPTAYHRPLRRRRVHGPAKRWLPERFARGRAGRARNAPAWNGKSSASEKGPAPSPTRSSPPPGGAVPCTDLVGKTTLAQFRWRSCAPAELLLTNDTGTMHLAALLGVPTVALFGSTEPSLTGPLGAVASRVAAPCFVQPVAFFASARSIFAACRRFLPPRWSTLSWPPSQIERNLPPTMSQQSPPPLHEHDPGNHRASQTSQSVDQAPPGRDRPRCRRAKVSRGWTAHRVAHQRAHPARRRAWPRPRRSP